jgi:hypothetical protein
MGSHRGKSNTEGVCPFSGAALCGGMSRRLLLAGAAGLAAVPVLAGGATAPAVTPIHRADRPAPPTAAGGARRAVRRAAKAGHAGYDLRGMDIAVRYGRDREARFGVMFKRLPAFSPDDALLVDLAHQMIDQTHPMSDVKDSQDGFNNSQMPAGYIYLGQFIDHDMTRDKTPLTRQRSDPRGLVNYDTPQFDLGSVYGGGPTANPELYDGSKPGKLLLDSHDRLTDLPRDEVGATHLGDPRNDENQIVAQLHVAFIKLHNHFIDDGKAFAEAQRLARWHYQWVIVNDFLPRMVGPDTVKKLLQDNRGRIGYNGKLYQPRNPSRPFMPVEYSGAAHRFGHSMIRAEYEIQDGHTVPVFGQDGHEDLRGSRPIPANMWMDWNYFFDVPGMHTPDDRNMARLIDTKISLPLSPLPSTVVAPVAGAITALAERNLLRGKRLGLPAGQDVAKAMGVKPLTNAELGLTDRRWGGKAPLWFYVLKESELLGGHRLGPVGAGIVAEVIIGLMALNRSSYFNAPTPFKPAYPQFRMGELLLMAGAIDDRARRPATPEAPDPAPEPAGPAALPDPAPPTV